MAGIFYTNSGALAKATAVKTALDGGKIRLFKSSFIPLVSSVLQDFVDNECDYDGYVAGGMTVAAWNAPLLDPAGGASIEMPITQFAYGPPTDPPVTNAVGGWFYTTAAGMLLCGEFPNPIPLQSPGQGLPLSVKVIEGAST
jgi:hypothetical protein